LYREQSERLTERKRNCTSNICGRVESALDGGGRRRWTGEEVDDGGEARLTTGVDMLQRERKATRFSTEWEAAAQDAAVERTEWMREERPYGLSMRSGEQRWFKGFRPLDPMVS
jgi:hypothetical protein